MPHSNGQNPPRQSTGHESAASTVKKCRRRTSKDPLFGVPQGLNKCRPAYYSATIPRATCLPSFYLHYDVRARNPQQNSGNSNRYRYQPLVLKCLQSAKSSTAGGRSTGNVKRTACGHSKIPPPPPPTHQTKSTRKAGDVMCWGSGHFPGGRRWLLRHV